MCYVFNARLVALYTNVIKKHNSINSTTYRRDVFDIRKIAEQSITECENIKDSGGLEKFYKDKKSLNVATQPNPSQLRPVRIDSSLVDSFIKIGQDHFRNDIEFCATICGTLKNGIFDCTHMLIPRQEGTENSCCALNELDMFDYQYKNNLITIGWIHSHPTQTAFLSSVDLRTHFGYQSSLNEAVAIVCAPKHVPKLGVFRIKDDALDKIRRLMVTNPNFGIRHEHTNEVLFEKCSHVQFTTNQNINVVDLR
ncbi:STAM-binding protein [Acrasis kona]|uniref:STAM-binding protein n=1 Tax=Acrasis kona TaxID=1008807 RepID=A0AAW2ZJQ2_9EUKA